MKEELGSLGAEFKDFDSAIIVVWDEKFLPVIAVEVIEAKCTNGSVLLFDGIADVCELVVGWGHDPSGVIAITCYEDVSWDFSGCAHLRVKGVRESRCHVGDSETEFVIEI